MSKVIFYSVDWNQKKWKVIYVVPNYESTHIKRPFMGRVFNILTLKMSA